MRLIRRAWKLLVAIKDALVLAALLLFFGLLFAGLAGRPGPARSRDGALVLKLDGGIVEQAAEVSPSALFTGGAAHQFRLRDLVRALDKAKGDAGVKVVVLDLDKFGGGYPAALQDVADAVARVRAAGKPVLSYATAYTDGAYRIAASATEIWTSPMGGTLFKGPGGTQLYYKGLFDKLGVNAHIYRVGKYKSAVEPYSRADASPEAKEEETRLYQVLFAQWQESVTKARPRAKFQQYLTAPSAVLAASGGDTAKANLAAGLVDKVGDRLDFDKRVAQLAGVDAGKAAGTYNTIKYDAYVDANPLPTAGDAIGVLTVAGELVDGKSTAGNAGADTIDKLVLDGLAKKKLKALVVRIDSPGGSVVASEDMRRAVMEAKAQKLPIVISMGSMAASGGYWISTAGDMIFAESGTITGSIGIFGIVPTFENALGKIGVTSDGVRTTPLSGQPDVYAGTTPEADATFQIAIENGYRQFVEHVSKARHLSPERVNEIGQGRVWDAGTARQIGLVDRFGGLQDAINEAARRAGLKPGDVHAEYLERKPGWLSQLARQLFAPGDDDSSGDAMTRIAIERRQQFARALGDIQRLGRSSAMQARCLECAALGPTLPAPGDATLAQLVLARLGFGAW